MGGFAHEVQPGGLSQADHDRIFALAEKGLGAQKISRKIGKHPSTVHWFMMSNGLRPLQQTETALVYQRNGRTVRRFTRQEDDFISALRVEDLTPDAIAVRVEQQFGYPRSAHSIRCRLMVLGAHEDA